jgi:hypothetical protein
MSRGPGRVERTIEAEFTANPSMTYLVDDIIAVAYPNEKAVAKKHRVAAIRAANSVAAILGWACRRAEQPRSHPLIYFNRRDHRGYAIGHNRCHHHVEISHEELVLRAADPQDECAEKWARDLQTGSHYWMHVEIFRAHLGGDLPRAQYLSDQLDKLPLGRNTRLVRV